MNRYKHLLSRLLPAENSRKIVGIFPHNTLIDTEKTNHKTKEIVLFEDGMEFLKKVSAKNISLVLFINQIIPHQLSMADFQEYVDGIDFVVKQAGVDLVGVYWCPNIDKRDPFVVPNPGMFIRVTENTGIKWDGLTVLSASDNDLSAATKVKAVPVKIGRRTKDRETYDSLNRWIDSL